MENIDRMEKIRGLLTSFEKISIRKQCIAIEQWEIVSRASMIYAGWI